MSKAFIKLITSEVHKISYSGFIMYEYVLKPSENIVICS
jgi:hypothetical protein